MADQAEPLPLPTDPQEFNSDNRISFSKVDSKFIAVQDDGEEYEFDHRLGRWIPLIEEEEIDNWQSAYNTHSAANESGKNPNKRKAGSDDQEDSHSNGRSSKQAKKNKNNNRPQQPRQNTAVYVTGLPLDATVEEVQELFQRKCGVIAEEIDSGRPRIKMYTDPKGHFKGDALIVFFKPQSVEMAIMLLDDTDFRFTPSDLTTGKMRVQAADSSYKKTKYEDQNKDETGDSDTNPSATNNGGPSRADHRARAGEKAKVIKKTQKLSAKLADWDDEPSTAQLAPKKNKVVILEHMFTLQELKEDPAALIEIKEDIREECSKLGTVTNVVLYDLEEDGIVRVKFKEFEAAEKCVQTLHGRMFGGQAVAAYFATGKEKFRMSKSADNEEGDDSD